ncbi:hypothetical protein BER44_004032 [Clostridioides difficile]|uniref:hypothetical protein n=1 Tax=Clostridioides difficile TaxID=1496 RepID=UPI00097B2D35|nr:hypothetical protein [Clostridioides difficile]OMK69558.1 hypothetical protein BER44_004032 [Clostridioides difficile]
MENYQSTNTCTYNILYVQFNEDFERSKYFSYDVKYPVIYNIRNQSTYVNPVILNNINNAVRMTVIILKMAYRKKNENIITQLLKIHFQNKAIGYLPVTQLLLIKIMY